MTLSVPSRTGPPRAVYLDADTRVLDSLAPLATVPLAGVPLGAVRNVVEPGMRGHVAALVAGGGTDYVNAGVLVLDLAALRAEDLVGASAEVVAGHGAHLAWYDQDALNVVFAGRWTALPGRWDAQNSFWTWQEWAAAILGEGEVAEAQQRPAVRHFVTSTVRRLARR